MNLPLLVLILPGCDRPAVEVTDVVDLGALETTSAVKARDGGYSGTFRGRSVWLYGDTILSLAGEDGSAWRDNSWSWTDDADGADGITGFTEPVDALGAPCELFPETADEAAYNDAHRDQDVDGDGASDCEEPCGGREVLWPMDMVETDSGALVFYVKIHGEPGAWNFYGRGSGVATWADWDVGLTRPEPNVVDDEPTLLFGPDEPGFGTAATLAPDGLLYAWGSRDETTGKQMRLGRVDPAEVAVRDAWTFWDGDGWSADPGDAKSTFVGSSQVKVSFDDTLGTWLAIYMDEPWNTLVYRTAPAPEGPWSEQAKVTDVEAPADGSWAYCGLDHPEYAHDGVHTISYYRSTGDWTGEIRLVQATFAAR